MGRSKCPGYLAQYLTKKRGGGICLVHDLRLKKKKRNHPMYLVQYLRSKTTTRVPNPGPTAKLERIMAHDSVHKKKKEEQIHMLLKIRSSIKKKKNTDLCHRKWEIVFNRKR